MNKRQAKKLYKKYVNNECSEHEKELLNSYLESFQDKKISLNDLNFDKDVKNKLWLQIASETSKNKRVVKLSIHNYLKYAAVFLVMISISVLFFTKEDNVKQPPLVISEEAIILRTGDNDKVVINTKNNQSLYKNGQVVGTQNGAAINYVNNEALTELVYNEIEIPHGKTFMLTLSDGTVVHLNAGTNMKFPVNFIKGKQREIYLDGEAYFEVAKDRKHPFIVNTSEMGVKVLGTHFNVNTYENTKSYTVLAEGSVVVYNQHKKNDIAYQKTIIPGQKASLTSENIDVKNVDINKYLSWREGRLLFNNDSFLNIIKKIERKYNVKIKNEYLELNNIRFKGDFKEETIIDLLDTFKESAGFNYKIIDNEIIINKPLKTK